MASLVFLPFRKPNWSSPIWFITFAFTSIRFVSTLISTFAACFNRLIVLKSLHSIAFGFFSNGMTIVSNNKQLTLLWNHCSPTDVINQQYTYRILWYLKRMNGNRTFHPLDVVPLGRCAPFSGRFPPSKFCVEHQTWRRL